MSDKEKVLLEKLIEATKTDQLNWGVGLGVGYIAEYGKECIFLVLGGGPELVLEVDHDVEISGELIKVLQKEVEAQHGRRASMKKEISREEKLENIIARMELK